MKPKETKYLPQKASVTNYPQAGKVWGECELEAYWRDSKLTNRVQLEMNRILSVYKNGFANSSDFQKMISSFFVENIVPTIDREIRAAIKAACLKRGITVNKLKLLLDQKCEDRKAVTLESIRTVLLVKIIIGG